MKLAPKIKSMAINYWNHKALNGQENLRKKRQNWSTGEGSELLAAKNPDHPSGSALAPSWKTGLGCEKVSQKAYNSETGLKIWLLIEKEDKPAVFSDN